MGIYLIHYTHLMAELDTDNFEELVMFSSNPDPNIPAPPINPDPNINPDLQNIPAPPINPDMPNHDPNASNPSATNMVTTGGSHAGKRLPTAFNPAGSAGRRRRTNRAYRERERRRQLRNDLGPKTKVRKVLPMNRDNAGQPIRRRTASSSYLYSTNLTVSHCIARD